MSIKDTYKRIINSKDGKALFSNLTYLFLLQIASYAFPLITIPYLARTIGTSGYGMISFATAIMTWIMTITDWGFNYTATRDVAKNRNNQEVVSEIFSTVLWSRIILMCISFIILLVIILSVPQLRRYIPIILVSFIMIPGHILFPQWFFQAIERMKFITILNVVAKLVFTLSVFLFIKEKEDYILQPLLTSLGFIVSGIVALYIIVNKWGIKIKYPNFSKCFRTIRNSTDVFINNLMPNLYNSLSVILLGFWGGPVANGIFDAANRIENIVQSFFNIISRCFYPFLARRSDKFKAYEKFNIILSIIITTILFFCAPFIIELLYTTEFSEAINILRILSLSIIFITLVNTYGTNYMILQGYEKELRKITTISSFTGLAIGALLIYRYHIIGTALTIVLSRGILGIGILFAAKKKMRLLK